MQTLYKNRSPIHTDKSAKVSPLRPAASAAGSPSQLPVASYFDTHLYAREMQQIFQNGPRYVGHALSVPNHGDYYALPQEGAGRALVRNARGP